MLKEEISSGFDEPIGLVIGIEDVKEVTPWKRQNFPLFPYQKSL
jgi:hypothetical protein